MYVPLRGWLKPSGLCVEELARTPERPPSVEGIADDRVVDGRQVDANLVGTAGGGMHVQQGVAWEVLPHHVLGLCLSSMLHNGHTLPVPGVAANSRLDTAAVGGE